MKCLLDGIYEVTESMGFTSMYVVENGDTLTVIDTGSNAEIIRKLQEGLKNAGRSPDDIAHILITHAHPDHTGGLSALQNLTNAPTYAHRREAPIIRGELPMVYPPLDSLGFIARMMRSSPPADPLPARVSVEFSAENPNGIETTLPGAVEIVEVPGHTPGQSAFYLPDRRILFAGDTFMRMPWGYALPLAGFTADMEEAKRSIKKVAAMDAEVLLQGHGPKTMSGGSKKLSKFAARL